MSVGDTIVDAMQILINDSITKAGYDRTIQAQIVSLKDANTGKYSCSYQGQSFQAYSNDLDTIYTQGTSVYILIPRNDMSLQKTIIGSVKKLGIDYLSEIAEEEKYNINGINGITTNGVFYLNTINQDYTYTIYQYGQLNNDINIDVSALQSYIQKSDSLIVAAKIKTKIPTTRRKNGSYGIIFKLAFSQANGDVYFQDYIFNENDIIGNPYALNTSLRQYKAFEIDGKNFKRIQSIIIYNDSFPGATETTTGIKIIPNSDDSNWDIEIKDLEIEGATKLTLQQLNGIIVNIIATKGQFFRDNDGLNQLPLLAQLKVKGKKVSSTSLNNVQFYWGVEDASISRKSPYYQRNLGAGWKCLNEIVSTDEETNLNIFDKGSENFNVSRLVATTRHNIFKVAVLYEGNVLTAQIDIENKSSNVVKITIENETNPNQWLYYHNIGKPTLVCMIEGSDLKSQDSLYVYYWSYIDNIGESQIISSQQEKDIEYLEAIETLKLLEEKLKNRTTLSAQQQEQLDACNEIINNYVFTQFSKGNRLYNTSIYSIVNFRVYKCTVYKKVNVNSTEMIKIGTASVTIRNSDENVSKYHLTINNGDAVYLYDESGIAPTQKGSKTVGEPQQINALTFSLYDKDDNLIDFNQIIKSGSVQWQFPIENTLLVDINAENDQITNSGLDPTLRYLKYPNVQTILYDLQSYFNPQKSLNQIKLKVILGQQQIFAQTNFTITKQGYPGTNGTDYVVRLVPNTIGNNNPPNYPIVTYYDIAEPFYKLNYEVESDLQEQNLYPNLSYTLFKLQIWKDGQLLGEGTDLNNFTIFKDDLLIQPTNINWSILQNTYSTIKKDASNFKVTDSFEGQIALDLSTNFQSVNSIQNILQPRANIVKCAITIPDSREVNVDGTTPNKIYYATMPIITAVVKNENLRVRLVQGTGFQYVMYDSNGMNPSFSSKPPFKFELEEYNIEKNIWESLAVKTSYENGKKYGQFKIGTNGNILLNDSLKNSFLLKAKNRTSSVGLNQIELTVSPRYDGQCINNSIYCIAKKNVVGQNSSNNDIAYIMVPIHLFLNRYSFSRLNDWDGNKIEINEDEGYILAPQMGAGVKESDNSFTGILMGEVKNPSKNIRNIGLLGYSSGSRSLFLNSQNGSALLGKAGNGQIIIDPSTDKALLYSSNYWQDYDEGTGLPKNYTNANINTPSAWDNRTTYKKGQSIIYGGKIYSSKQNDNYNHTPGENDYWQQGSVGMLIDLTTPQIKFASNNFSVDKYGNLQASNANISGIIKASTLEVGIDDMTVTGVGAQNNEITTLRQIFSTFRTNDATIETWVQSTDPSKSWKTTELELHNGDLWYYTGTTQLELTDLTGAKIQPLKVYMYNSVANKWQIYDSPSNSLFDMINGKKTIYFQSNPPDLTNVQTNDLFIDSDTNKIWICKTELNTSTNAYEKSWQEVKNYNEALESLETQLDKRIETHARATDPSVEWDEDIKILHNGDFWYYTGTSPISVNGTQILPSRTYEYKVISNNNNQIISTEWVLKDGDYESLFDFADGKSTIYYGNNRNLQPADDGDMYVEIKTVNGNTEKKIYIYRNGSWTQIDNYASEITTLRDTINNLGDIKQSHTSISDPSTGWTAAQKPDHVGDLWYYIGSSNTTANGVTIQPQKVYVYNSSYNWEEYTGNDINSYLFRQNIGSRNIFYTESSNSNNWPAGANDGDVLIYNNQSTKDSGVYRYDESAHQWVAIQMLSDLYGVVVKRGGIVSVEGSGNTAIQSFDLWKDWVTYTKDIDYVIYGGNIFKCKTTGSGHKPPTSQTNNSYWTYESRNIFAIPKSGAIVGSDMVMTGTVFSSRGLIGGFKLGQWKDENKVGETQTFNGLFYGTPGTSNSIAIMPTTLADESIESSGEININHVTRNNWVITAGTNFGITNKGQIYANSGHIGNLQIKNQIGWSKWVSGKTYNYGDNIYVLDDQVNKLYKPATSDDYVAFSGSAYPHNDPDHWVEQDGPFEGYIGYRTGLSGAGTETQGVTIGVENNETKKHNYLIATTEGIRMTSGSTSGGSWQPSIYATSSNVQMLITSTTSLGANKITYTENGQTQTAYQVLLKNGPNRYIDINGRAGNIFLTSLGNTSSDVSGGVCGVEIGTNPKDPLVLYTKRSSLPINVANQCQKVVEHTEVFNRIKTYTYTDTGTTETKICAGTSPSDNYIAIKSSQSGGDYTLGLAFKMQGYKEVRLADILANLGDRPAGTKDAHTRITNLYSQLDTVATKTNSMYDSFSTVASNAEKAWWSVGTSPDGKTAHKRITAVDDRVDHLVKVITKMDLYLNYCYKAITSMNISYPTNAPSSTGSSNLWT